jgi:hypothetical protein
LTTLLAATSWSVGCATITPLPPPPPLDISVTILPTSGVVTLGNQLTFTATVKNSSDEAVSWSVSGVSGGNTSLGTITVGGVYTAPQDLPNPASVQIVATSHADTPKSATATVQIQSDIGITLGSGSGPTLVELGASQVFQASMTSGGPSGWDVAMEHERRRMSAGLRSSRCERALYDAKNIAIAG